jgi:tRNA 2-thiouridine synthesizing protein A
VIELDCRGQRCPLPVIALAKTIRQVEIGQVVRVRADDPAAAGDIPAWCRLTGQEFVCAGDDEYDVRRIS